MQNFFHEKVILHFHTYFFINIYLQYKYNFIVKSIYIVAKTYFIDTKVFNALKTHR